MNDLVCRGRHAGQQADVIQKPFNDGDPAQSGYELRCSGFVGL